MRSVTALAKTHKTNNHVTKIKGIKIFFDTSSVFFNLFHNTVLKKEELE